MWRSSKEWILRSVPCGESMRSRKEIELDGLRKDILMLEVLLDVRMLIEKLVKNKMKVKRDAKTR